MRMWTLCGRIVYLVQLTLDECALRGESVHAGVAFDSPVRKFSTARRRFISPPKGCVVAMAELMGAFCTTKESLFRSVECGVWDRLV